MLRDVCSRHGLPSHYTRFYSTLSTSLYYTLPYSTTTLLYSILTGAPSRARARLLRPARRAPRGTPADTYIYIYIYVYVICILLLM